MKPLLRGKRARWLGSLDQPHTLNYLEDMARALVTLGERDEADGEVWHLPAAAPLTGRQFLTLVFEAAEQPPKVGVASRPMIRIAGLFSRSYGSSTRRSTSSSDPSSQTRRSSMAPSARSSRRRIQRP